MYFLVFPKPTDKKFLSKQLIIIPILSKSFV